MKDSQMRWFSDGSERRSRQKDFGVSPVQRLTSHVHQQLLCDWMVLLQARSPSISTDTDPCPEPSCKGQCRVLSLFLSPGKIALLLSGIVNLETFKESKSQNENEYLTNHTVL